MKVHDAWIEFRLWLKLHEPWWVEIFSGLTSISWGFYSLIDGRDMAGMPWFLPVTRFLPEYFFVDWAVLMGFTQFAAALLHIRVARIALSLIQMLLFGILMVSILKSDQPGPGVAAYGGWWAANMAAFIRLAFR